MELNMKALTSTSRRRQLSRHTHGHDGQGSGGDPVAAGHKVGGDPLAYVKADELRNLVIDLDETYSDLMGRANNGDNGAFALAQVVRTAADFVAELRFAR